MHTRQAHIMLIAIAACLGVMAYGYARFKAPVAGGVLWPWVFGGACVSCLCLALRLTRHRLLVSGLVVPLSFAARLGGVVADAITGHQADPARSATSIALFLLLTLLSATTWVFVLGPLVSWSEQRRGQ